MSSQTLVKPASVRQLAYIRRLCTEMGESEPEISQKMNSPEASRVISGLIVKARQNGVEGVQVKINEPRLGMATKECFRLWNALGRDVLGDRRSAFIREAINTYELFTEVAEKVERGACDAIEQSSEGAMEADSAA